MRRSLTVFASVGLLIGHAHAANVGQFTSKEGREVVTLTGEITSGDADRVSAAIKSANDAGRVVSGIRLNSPGGMLVESVKLAEAIRFAKIATVVMNNTICASACFVVFAAGTEKFVSYTAQVGVHGASNAGADTVEAKAATIAMAKLIKELGVPTSIIGQMVVTSPDQMVWLTPADLQSMGVKMTGKPVQTPPTASIVPPAGSGIQTQTETPGLMAAALPMSKDAKWIKVTNFAYEQSAMQNKGTADFRRNCQPEMKVCTTAIFFRNETGKQIMVRRATDADDHTLTRDVCTFNQFGDVRECLNIDSDVVTKEMRNGSGIWADISN